MELLELFVAGLPGHNSGLGAYVDAGAEILRTHHTHLALGLRLDLPFYALNNNNGAPKMLSRQPVPR